MQADNVMNVTFITPIDPLDVLGVIVRATDKARFDPKEFLYDASSRTYQMILYKSLFKRTRFGFLGSDKGCGHLINKIIIKIHGVESVNASSGDEQAGLLVALFGIRFSDDGVYLCSADEYRGVPVFQVDIKTHGLELEITSMESITLD